MANDARLKIIIDALNLASDELERVEGDLQGVTGASKKSASSWTELNSAIGVGKQALQTVSQAYQEVIGKSLEWGGTVDELSRITGQSAAETSTFAVVLQDLGIDLGKLKGAASALKEQGLTPNLGTIKELAEKYQSFDNAAARTEWGVKTLGKAYYDLSEILDQSPEKMDALAEAARRSGKVIGEETVAKMEELEIKTAQFNDQLDGLKIQATELAVGPGTQLLKFAGDSVGVFGLLNEANQKGALSAGQYAAAVGLMITPFGGASRAADFLRQKIDELPPIMDGYDESARAAMRTTTSLADGWTSLSVPADVATASAAALASTTDIVATAQRNEALAAEEARIKSDLLTASFGELTNQLIFQKVAASLDADGQLALAREMGLVNEETYAGLTAAQQLKEKYDANHDGAVSAAEGAAQYIAQLSLLKNQMDGLQDKTVTVTVVTQGDIGQVVNSDSGRTVRRASGGPVAAGMPYWVGEQGPELIIPQQSGTVVPAGQSAQLAGGGQNNFSNVFNISNPDPRAVAREVSQILAAQARAMTLAGARYVGS